MILLVENNSDDAELILGTLQQQLPASNVHHAHNGNEAIDLIKQWDGEPLQLVLLNINLPGLSGLEVLEQLRAKRETRHVPVVMLGASEDSHDVSRSYDLGANSFISKSSHGADFSETVKQIVPYWLELNQPYIQLGPED